jgi:hypothetical protein
MEQFGHGWPAYPGLASTERRETRSESEGSGGSKSRSQTLGRHEQLVPIHEDFMELASRTYMTFDEDRLVWGRNIRRAKRGEAFIRLVDAPEVYHVDVKRSAAGHLGMDLDTLASEMPDVLDDIERLVERNFKLECFCSSAAIEAETAARLQRILRPRISLPPNVTQDPTAPSTPFV